MKKTPEEHAQIIREACTVLNNAIHVANADDLRVELELKEFDLHGRRFKRPAVLAMLSKVFN